VSIAAISSEISPMIYPFTLPIGVIGYFNERFQGEWLAMPRVTVSILSFFNFSILTCAAGKKVVNER
jgi:hypothetical protein